MGRRERSWSARRSSANRRCLFNEYTLVTIKDDYLRLDAHGFNADGSVIGVLDSFEIGTDPGPDSDGDGMRDAWEIANGLDPNDATGENGAGGDLDGDGATNFAELIAGTAADDPDSTFRVVTATRGTDTIEVTWSSVPGHRYQIHTSTDLGEWEALEQSPGEPLVVDAEAGVTTTYAIPTPADVARVFVQVLVAP